MDNNMNPEQILTCLDKHAAEFNFPVLDNAYVEFAASRLTAFRSQKEWLIVFEVLGFSTQEVQFVDDIYAYGSCLDREGFVGEEIPFNESAEAPFFDPETNECVIDSRNWIIERNGHRMSFSPSHEEYADAGIEVTGRFGPGSLKEIELLRYLVHRFGDDLFISAQELMAKFPRCHGMQLFVQSTQWQHPDIAGEEKPSRNVSISSLVDALSNRDPSLFREGRPNTDWRFWAGGPGNGNTKE